MSRISYLLHTFLKSRRPPESAIVCDYFQGENGATIDQRRIFPINETGERYTSHLDPATIMHCMATSLTESKHGCHVDELCASGTITVVIPKGTQGTSGIDETASRSGVYLDSAAGTLLCYLSHAAISNSPQVFFGVQGPQGYIANIPTGNQPGEFELELALRGRDVEASLNGISFWIGKYQRIGQLEFGFYLSSPDGSHTIKRFVVNRLI